MSVRELKRHFCVKHQEPELTAPHDVVCKLCKTKRTTNLATYTYCKECALFKERCSQCGNLVQPRSPSRGSPKGMKQDLLDGLYIIPINKSELPRYTCKDYCCVKHQTAPTFTAPYEVECPHCLLKKMTYLRRMWHCDECAVQIGKCSACCENLEVNGLSMSHHDSSSNPQHKNNREMSMLRRLSEVVPVALGLKKSPKDIVLSSVESFKTLQAHRAFLRPDSSNSANNSESEEDYTYNRAVEDLSKNLQAMKCILYGESDNEEPRKNEAMELASIMVSSHFLLLLVQYMECLDLEARKDASAVFNNIIKIQVNARYLVVEYIQISPQILFGLLNGYEKSDVALFTGSMLRECLKFENLTHQLLLHPSEVFKLFQYVNAGDFEIESDALSTFKDLLSRHKTLAADFLVEHYNEFFEQYCQLLTNANFVTKSTSIRTLGEILMDRSNMEILKRYVNDRANLKLMMNLLLDKSKTIQSEAFHIFKLFVVNPYKDDQIIGILYMNKGKLIKYLEKFQIQDDFADDKGAVMSGIEQLERPCSMGTEPFSPCSPSCLPDSPLLQSHNEYN